MKTVMIVGGIVGFLFIAFLLFAPTTEEAARNSPQVNEFDTSTVQEDDIDLAAKPQLFIGDPDAPATFVEYGDFKCPACNQFHRGAGKQLRDEYVADGRLKIEFRNFPFIGPDSGRAARGTYCANDQGVFTEYHDRVYDYMWDNYYAAGDFASEFTDELTVDVIASIMDGVVSDSATFRDCLESTTFNASVTSDITLGRGAGISGTPGFTVAGQRITGPSNFNTFKTLVDIQLQNSN